MDPERWRLIQSVFHQAADLPPAERRQFLDGACAGDTGLLADVERLLDEDARGTSLLDAGVGHAAERILGKGAARHAVPPSLGPYRIVERLGEGGMGIVYLAERPDLGHRVAIKVLRDAWLSPARRERFFSEQRTLAQLSHPLIASLYDADTLADGTPWFAMEYVDGVPLTDYCRRHATSIPGRLQLFRGVCEAVLYAHQHAVIHRDLKPSNILVKPDGSVRLLDFGIAKQLDLHGAQAEQTRTGLQMMTPAYAAPEQVRGEQIGIHTDVYSLGVVLYELLAGRLPFDLEGRTPGEAARIVAEHEAERPSSAARRIAAALPAGRPAAPSSRTAWNDLDVLCLTAMHRDPQRRYHSVEALIRDIDHFLRGEPLEARTDTFSYRAAKFVGRNRQPVIAVVVALSVIVGLVAFYTIRLAAARNTALDEASRAQRIQQFMLHLFEGGDADAGPADDLRVLTLIERGEQDALALDADPDVQSELYLTLGSIYEKLGKLDRAESLLQLALDLQRSQSGRDHAAVAECLIALAELRLAQARLDEADALVRDGLEMSRRHLPDSHPQVARATATLGRLLQERGEYDAAIAMLDDAVRMLSVAAEPSVELSATLSELANAHFYAGHLDESEALNLRVLEIDRRIWGERHPHVADGLINLGAIRFNQGRYADAERLDRDALEIIEAWYGADHPETASAMTILGRALVYQGQADEARVLLERALAIQEHVYGSVHPRVASALNDLAAAAIQHGDLDRAEALYGRMGEIYRQIYDERHHLVALALANQASVDLERQRFDRAEIRFRDVVARYTEALSPDDLNTGIARIKLGRALIGQRRFDEALGESLAGYEIVSRLTEPTVSWLRSARSDLVAAYEALNQPEKAERFRTEQAALRPTAVTSAER